MVNFWVGDNSADLAYLILKVQERIVIDYALLSPILSAGFHVKFDRLEF